MDIIDNHLTFIDAVRAIDSGDVAGLAAVLAACPDVIRYRCTTGEHYERGYFSGATLLHHIAGNPIRCPIPRNIVEIARLLLDCGADPNALTPNGSSVIGLLLTSKQASEAGVAVILIDLLIERGADDAELLGEDVLSLPLWNHARATAEELVGRGVRMDARHAAALGKLDVLPSLVDGLDQLALERALVYACVQNEIAAATLLIDRGAKGDVTASPQGNSSALHNAAWRGHRELLRLMLDNGANPNIRDTEYQGTPADWADHAGHHELAQYIRSFAPSVA